MHNIETAIHSFKNGKFVIVVDDKDRENEGDLIMAADFITPEAITFMAKKASGLICLAITENKAKQLNLKLQRHGEHRPLCNTAFTYSIDARFGISTGISSVDRVHTIKTVMQNNVCPADIVVPGHIFPVIAKAGGVLERPGHTESAVDLAQLAGLNPAGVICEIMNDNGVMIHGDDLMDFAKQYDIPIISTQDLINYRQQHVLNSNIETLSSIKVASETQLNTKYGIFNMITFFYEDDPREHVALIKGDLKCNTGIVRIHSECLTGDVFSSLHCDCGEQLQQSLQTLSEAPLGIMIYLKQEGRDIGLTNKLRAYHLQQQGHDTVDANLMLGLPIDNRHFKPATALLNHYKLSSIQLLTNNPDKVSALKKAGFEVERLPLVVNNNCHNYNYLKTKQEKLAHLLSIEE